MAVSLTYGLCRGYRFSNNVLEAQGLLDLVKEACNNIGLVLDDKKGNS